MIYFFATFLAIPKSYFILACAFKTNTSIRDLYFAENNLNPTDAGHLYQIILANTSIELLDLRNNQLQVATQKKNFIILGTQFESIFATGWWFSSHL